MRKTPCYSRGSEQMPEKRYQKYYQDINLHISQVDDYYDTYLPINIHSAILNNRFEM